MKTLLKSLGILLSLLFAGGAFGLLAAGAAYMYVADSLPDVETLKSVQLEAPLRVYSRDGVLIGEFGEKRRIPVTYAQFPQAVVDAFVAAEDDRFFEHPGVDYQGLMRAVIVLASTGEASQGGSTITMQVARNYLLTLRRSYLRKVREIFVALNMERVLSKQEILTLYLNKIFFGQRAYGVAAAAEVYFGKTLQELRLDEIAILAGLPKAPSELNPITSPSKARTRRDYVLRRMFELGYIDAEAMAQARERPVVASLHGPKVEGEAAYLAEMARAELVARYGQQVYGSGYRVVTTLDSELQASAVEALRTALLDYDRRHGWRGPLDRRELAPPGADGRSAASLDMLLAEYPALPLHRLAIVLEADAQAAQVHVAGYGTATLGLDAVKWARRYIDESRIGAVPTRVDEVLAAGDVVYLRATGAAAARLSAQVGEEAGSLPGDVDEEDAGEALDDGDDAAAEDAAGGAGGTPGWRLGQAPAVQGAVVSLDPIDSAVTALVGGYDFQLSKFNRAAQAKRQPGSSFKPFIYSAALEHGFTTATVVPDAPVVFDDPGQEEVWRPENYEREFRGPMRLREALVASRNLVSIRVLREVGIAPTVEHLEQFGFDAGELPRSLSLALGSASLTPWQMASAYAVLANGGFGTESYFIDRIEDANGRALFEAAPRIACTACERAAEARARAEAERQRREIQRAAGGASAPVAAADAADAPLPASWPSDEAACRPAPGWDGYLPLEAMAPRVVSAQNIFLITDMMRDVVRRGTGRRAYRELGRGDLAGKTGTTNDQRDAWFSGFNADLVASVWVGFDDFTRLGRGEVGGRAALPAWIAYMGDALEGRAEHTLEQPFGLVRVKISPQTGKLAGAGDEGAIYELFRADQVPEAAPLQATSPFDEGRDEQSEAETLF